MQRTTKTKAAASIVDEASSSLSALVEGLADPLAEFMLAGYSAEDWRDSPAVEALASVAALLEAEGPDVPGSILAALRKATEAGRGIGVCVT